MKKKFLSDESGGFGPLVAIALFVLLLGVGVAVDLTRQVKAKSFTQDTLDAAVLSGAKLLADTGDKQKARKAAEDYFHASLQVNAPLLENNVKFKVNPDGTILEGAGHSYIPTTLMGIAGIDKLGAGVNSRAQIGAPAGANIELALVMDMSGSMCGTGAMACSSSTKLDAAKNAAVSFIEQVIQDDQSQFSSRASVIPFGLNLRIASGATPDPLVETLTGLPPTWSGWKQQCEEWVPAPASDESNYVSCAKFATVYMADHVRTNCISDRYFINGNYVDTSENPPGSGSYFHAVLGDRFPLSRDSADTPLTSGLGLVETDPASTRTYEANIGPCWNPNSNTLLPLTSDKTKIINHLKGLTANGETAGPIGIGFGWFTLSDKWRSIWPQESQPEYYTKLSELNSAGEPLYRKIAIIMSDGAFNTYLGRPKDKTTTAGYAVEFCDNMKKQKIEIFTIGYDLDSIPQADRDLAQETLKNCASDADHYKYSENTADLKAAFEEIGVGLEDLRLIQ